MINLIRKLVSITVISVLMVPVASISLSQQIYTNERQKGDTSSVLHNGGFTGADVPSLPVLLGDYVNIGTRTDKGRTDISKLINILKRMNAKDYMHLVWKEKRYPGAWQDFQLMAPKFQDANIRLWLYLTPPSEGVPEPYGGDYVRWATECAKVAAKYPIVMGICIDDFNGNVRKFNPSYCKQMMQAAHKIAPHLSFLVVCYFGYQKYINTHVKMGVIDGVIFPYFYPHQNHSNVKKLLPQIKSYRKWLDNCTKKGKLSGKMPLVVMVYATKHSASPNAPTPDYVKKCLEVGLKATQDKTANGVVTYCLPKSKPEFVNHVGIIYHGWEANRKEGKQ